MAATNTRSPEYWVFISRFSAKYLPLVVVKFLDLHPQDHGFVSDPSIFETYFEPLGNIYLVALGELVDNPHLSKFMNSTKSIAIGKIFT